MPAWKTSRFKRFTGFYKFGPLSFCFGDMGNRLSIGWQLAGRRNAASLRLPQWLTGFKAM